MTLRVNSGQVRGPASARRGLGFRFRREQRQTAVCIYREMFRKIFRRGAESRIEFETARRTKVPGRARTIRQSRDIRPAAAKCCQLKGDRTERTAVRHYNRRQISAGSGIPARRKIGFRADPRIRQCRDLRSAATRRGAADFGGVLVSLVQLSSAWLDPARRRKIPGRSTDPTKSRPTACRDESRNGGFRRGLGLACAVVLGLVRPRAAEEDSGQIHGSDEIETYGLPRQDEERRISAGSWSRLCSCPRLG